jgi:hypothetical protein
VTAFQRNSTTPAPACAVKTGTDDAEVVGVAVGVAVAPGGGVGVAVGVAVSAADTVAEGKGGPEQSPQSPLPSTGQTEYQYVLPSVGLLCV